MIQRLKQRVSGVLDSKPIAKRVGSAVGWSLVGNLSWRFLTMVSAVAIARILGKGLFGYYGLIQDAVATFGVLASFRLGSTATRFISRHYREDKQRTGEVVKLTGAMAMVTSAIAALAVIVAAPLIIKYQLKDSTLLCPLIIAAVAMYFRLFSNVLEFSLAGFEAFSSVALVNFVKGFCTVALVAPLAWVWGLVGVFAGLVGVSVVALLITMWRLKKCCIENDIPSDVTLAKAWQQRDILKNFALPGVISGLLEVLAVWQIGVMLLSFAGEDQVGIFKAANQWRMLVMFLPSIIGRAVLPVMSQSFGRKGDEFNKAIQVNLRFMWMLALPMSVMIIGFSDVLAGVFGKEFEGCEHVLPWLICSVFAYGMAVAARQIFDGAAKRWPVVAFSAAAALTMLIVTKLALPRYVASAPAIGMLAGYGLMLVCELVFIELFIARRQVIKRLGLYMLSAALLTAACAARFELSAVYSACVCAVLLVISSLPLVNVLKRVKSGRPISG